MTASTQNGNQVTEMLAFTDDFIPGVTFSVVGPLDTVESLLAPIQGVISGFSSEDYRPYVIAYQFTTVPRYAITFARRGIDLSSG